MAQRHVDGRAGDMHETIETTALSGDAGAAPAPPAKKAGSGAAAGAVAGGAAAGKACCACGKDVTGQKRFKDAQGRYWCYDCGVEDHVRKHPEDGIACVACAGKFPPSKLSEFDGGAYCEPCLVKKKSAKKREDSRLAAAAEESRRQEKRRKLMLISGAAAAAVACGVVVWRVVF